MLKIVAEKAEKKFKEIQRNFISQHEQSKKSINKIKELENENMSLKQDRTKIDQSKEKKTEELENENKFLRKEVENEKASNLRSANLASEKLSSWRNEAFVKLAEKEQEISLLQDMLKVKIKIIFFYRKTLITLLLLGFAWFGLIIVSVKNGLARSINCCAYISDSNDFLKYS